MRDFEGRLIVLDGPDGCGKSTQVEKLCAWIETQGGGCAHFRDPGDTAIGEGIRDLLLSPKYAAMGDMTEILLFMASRVQLWTEKIKPALEAGQCVVLDRWLSSTCAYQGHAAGFGVDRVIRIAEECLERVWPDVTIILDVDLETATTRMDRELDRMEQKGGGYHQLVREGYLNLTNGRDQWYVVDATQSVDQVHEQVIAIVKHEIL